MDKLIPVLEAIPLGEFLSLPEQAQTHMRGLLGIAKGNGNPAALAATTTAAAGQTANPTRVTVRRLGKSAREKEREAKRLEAKAAKLKAAKQETAGAKKK